MVKIEFFKRNKSLGSFPLKDCSNHSDRDQVAKINGIQDYDRFILDDGRIVGARVGSGVNHYEHEGRIWLSWESRSPFKSKFTPKEMMQYPMTTDEAYPSDLKEKK